MMLYKIKNLKDSYVTFILDGKCKVYLAVPINDEDAILIFMYEKII
jgi:hypothetical protein